MSKRNDSRPNRSKQALAAALLFIIYLLWLFGPLPNRLSQYFGSDGQLLYTIKAPDPVKSLAFHKGKIYALTAKDELLRYTSAGRLIDRQKVTGCLPRRVAVDDRGYIYFSASNAGTFSGFLMMYDSQLNLISRHDYNEEFMVPYAVFAAKKLYVSDLSSGLTRIFTSTEPVLKEEKRFGSAKGSWPGQFKGVYDISSSEDGTLYIVDRGNKRLQVYNPNATLRGTIPRDGSLSTLSDPVAVDVYGNKVYVLDQKKGRVFAFDNSGLIIGGYAAFKAEPDKVPKRVAKKKSKVKPAKVTKTNKVAAKKAPQKKSRTFPASLRTGDGLLFVADPASRDILVFKR